MFLVKFPEVDHSRVSLRLIYWPKNSFKWVQIEIFTFFHVFDNPFANTSRSMRQREKIVEVESVLRKISYKVGLSRVSLHLPFNLEIH